jgi:hypothetical protein
VPAEAVAATVIPSVAMAAVVTARIVLRMLAVSLSGTGYCRLLVVASVPCALCRVPLRRCLGVSIAGVGSVVVMLGTISCGLVGDLGSFSMRTRVISSADARGRLGR